MINSIADLLNELKQVEIQRINAQGIPHRTTIGNQYEGLTAELLNRAVFASLNLKVITNSFIIGPNGERSKEMDIMLIEGEGKQLLYTKEQFDVNFNQVIAVIQVKKRLNRQQIEDAFLNFAKIEDFIDFDTYPCYALDIFRDAYKSICSQEVLVGGKWRKSFSSATEELIFHMLKIEAALPARIVFGYIGFTSEYNFRKGLLKYISENKSEPNKMKFGFGPLNYPDLIMNGNFSLVKGNGMPYVGPIRDDKWNFYVSTDVKPLQKLIEIIWTRLAYRYKLDAIIFGEDLKVESFNPLLMANLVNVGGLRGWNFEYHPMSEKILKGNNKEKDWEPVTITEEQHHVVAYLCKHGKLHITKINEWLALISRQVDEQRFAEQLSATGLTWVDRQELKLLTEQCTCVFVPGLGYVAADDKTGKLTRWLRKRTGG